MDEISREKEEYFADGVLWSDNHSNTSSDTKTVFERITCGCGVRARVCDQTMGQYTRMREETMNKPTISVSNICEII